MFLDGAGNNLPGACFYSSGSGGTVLSTHMGKNSTYRVFGQLIYITN